MGFKRSRVRISPARGLLAENSLARFNRAYLDMAPVRRSDGSAGRLNHVPADGMGNLPGEMNGPGRHPFPGKSHGLRRGKKCGSGERDQYCSEMLHLLLLVFID